MAVLDSVLVRLGVDMSDAEDEVDRGSQSITDRLGGLSGVGTAAAAGLGTAFVTGLGAAMDISSVTTQLQNQLDLTGEEAARAGDVAGDVFSAGFGESLDEVGEAVSAVSSSMHEFGSISDEEMTQLSKDALALSKTFQFDLGEATAAAGNLIKSGLAKDGTEAMDLLAATAQKVPAAMREELPALTKEYSEFFSQLGFTGPEMFGLLAQAAKDPNFELDKLGDAVKEFSLRLADTDAAKEPLEELGLDVAHIQKLVNTGQGTKAFDEVVTALKNVDDQTKRTTLQAALFGGPGEDMGRSLLNLKAGGAAAATGLDDAAGAAKAVTDRMESSPGQQFDSIMRTLSTTLGQALLPSLNRFSELLKENPELVSVLVPLVLLLAAGLAGAAAAQWAMNSALLANPMTWIVLGILALVAAIVLIAQRTTFFQDLWSSVWGSITTAFDDTVDWIGDRIAWFGTLPGLLGGWFDDAKNAATGKLTELVLWIAGVPGWVFGVLSGWGGDLARSATEAFTSMRTAAVRQATGLVTWTGRLPGNMAGALTSQAYRFYNVGLDFVYGIWDGISAAGGWLWSNIQNFAHDYIIDPVVGLLKIGSPSKLAADEIGHWIPAGIAVGAEDNAGVVDETMRNLLDPGAYQTTGLLQGMTSPVARKVQPANSKTVLELRGGNRLFREFLQESVRTDAGGSITRYAEG
ncbi:phage tail tape measure protein [Streptomyces sp. STCH 565 A]|uniref:phage tail tape measure protein n=1 Tax=Streptomyces sp. STCH 565 A TaxID=2950532 RepID=UPI002075D6EC|nr:phage tail tape measure protein [Streptomyces sp. STCH 565 A]MCM8550074.1 hypothetical protein [Streptomyces sp. STCH 565 A]